METPSYIHIDSNFRDKNNFPNPFSFTVLENQTESWLKLGGCKQKEEALVKIERMTIPYPRTELFATTFIEVSSVSGVSSTVLTSVGHGLVDGDIVEVVIAPITASPFVYGAQYLVDQLTADTFELTPVGGGTAISNVVNQTYSGKNRLRFALVNNVINSQLATALAAIKQPSIFVDFYSKRYNDLDLIDTIGGNIRNAKFIVYTHNSLIQNDEYGNPIWIHFICDTPQVLRFKKNDALTIRLQDRVGKTLNLYPESPSDDAPLKQLLLTLSFKW